MRGTEPYRDFVPQNEPRPSTRGVGEGFYISINI